MSDLGAGVPGHATDQGAGAAGVADLHRLLAERDDQLRERLQELAAEAAERRHMQADLAVKEEYLRSLRARVSELERDLAGLSAQLGTALRRAADSDAQVAERRAEVAAREAELDVLHRDARRWDRVRRLAHRAPLYLRVVRPVVSRVLSRRRPPAPPG